MQRAAYGLERIVREDYLPAEVVVSTRLHGAIIAYGLGIPYVAVPRDEKVRAFHRLHGNGILCEDPADVGEAVAAAEKLTLAPIAIEPVRAFGRRASEWARSFGTRPGLESK